jgi:S-DNA-T family DNA segregation ATPase FtsK/SpoIIIE
VPVILRLTVQNINSREIGDIEINASPDDWVGTLLSVLPGVLQGDACFVGATLLDPRSRLAGSPLLPGAVLSVGGAGPDYQPVRRAAAGTLHVVAGRDAGFGVALRPGRYFIGRAADTHVGLDDADVSRMHALVEVSADGGAVLADAGSRNGTWVDGTRVSAPTALAAGSVVRIGQDTLRWVGAGQSLRVLQTADGRLEFDRRITAIPAIPVREVALPTGEPARRNLAARGASLLLGQRGREKRAAVQARAAAREQAVALVADEERARRLAAPGPAEIAAMTSGARPDLWARDAAAPYGLVLRVGVADQEPSVRLHGSPGDDLELPALNGVPVTIDLRETGVLGVLGDGEPARALLRWLIVQLAVLRSPDDLRLVLLTPDTADGLDGDLAWTRWLPHLDGGATAGTPCLIGNTDASRAARIGELRQLISARTVQRGGPGPALGAGFDGDVVVVLDGALGLRDQPGVRDILKFGPEAGVYLLCADRQGITELRGRCELTTDGLRLLPGPDCEPVTAAPDGVDRARAEQVARALAPMRDRGAAAKRIAVPYPARLLDLLGLGPPSAQDIVALWSQKPAGPVTRVVLGADASGPVTVDLAAHGPHLMLGGAAGTGKTTLLQTLVTGLLLANRPDELNLMLVDCGGGGAFLPFENCPHLIQPARPAGETVADTSGAADAARFVAFLRAELSRRELVLAAHGAEIDQYWRAREIQPVLPRLPRIVVMFDGFGRGPGISPGLMDELVSVTARGGALGVHVVLATQAPRWLPAPLKDNVPLRISLRQDEAADSLALLGTPDAIAIPGSLRGRGLVVSTLDETRTPRLFQSAYLGDPPPATRVSRLTVRPLAWSDLGTAGPAPARRGGGGATERDLVIGAVEEAVRHIRVTAPFPAVPPQ